MKNTCKHCKKEYERKRFNGRLEDLTRYKKRVFCSKLCQYKYGLDHEKTRQWLGRKIQRYKKDKCESCKGDHWLGVHHRDRDWRNNDIDNLITLCASCHSKLHWNKGDYDHRRTSRKCDICGLPHKAKGYCNKHYRNWKNTGNPYGKKTTQLGGTP